GGQVTPERARDVRAGDAQGGEQGDGGTGYPVYPGGRGEGGGRGGAQGDGQVELLAIAGVGADVVDEVALGLRGRCQRNRPAAAAEQRLNEVEVDGRDAGQPLGPRQEVEDGVVGERGRQQGAGAEQLAHPGAAVERPVVLPAGGGLDPGPLADGVLDHGP